MALTTIRLPQRLNDIGGNLGRGISAGFARILEEQIADENRREEQDFLMRKLATTLAHQLKMQSRGFEQEKEVLGQKQAHDRTMADITQEDKKEILDMSNAFEERMTDKKIAATSDLQKDQQAHQQAMQDDRQAYLQSALGQRLDFQREMKDIDVELAKSEGAADREAALDRVIKTNQNSIKRTRESIEAKKEMQKNLLRSQSIRDKQNAIRAARLMREEQRILDRRQKRQLDMSLKRLREQLESQAEIAKINRNARLLGKTGDMQMDTLKFIGQVQKDLDIGEMSDDDRKGLAATLNTMLDAVGVDAQVDPGDPGSWMGGSAPFQLIPGDASFQKGDSSTDSGPPPGFSSVIAPGS